MDQVCWVGSDTNGSFHQNPGLSLTLEDLMWLERQQRDPQEGRLTHPGTNTLPVNPREGFQGNFPFLSSTDSVPTSTPCPLLQGSNSVQGPAPAQRCESTVGSAFPNSLRSPPHLPDEEEERGQSAFGSGVLQLGKA